MSATIYLMTIFMVAGTILLIFGLRAWAQVRQARARLDGETIYRTVAERATAAQSETSTALAAVQATLTDIAARLASVEKVLKEVE